MTKAVLTYLNKFGKFVTKVARIHFPKIQKALNLINNFQTKTKVDSAYCDVLWEGVRIFWTKSHSICLVFGNFHHHNHKTYYHTTIDHCHNHNFHHHDQLKRDSVLRAKMLFLTSKQKTTLPVALRPIFKTTVSTDAFPWCEIFSFDFWKPTLQWKYHSQSVGATQTFFGLLVVMISPEMIFPDTVPWNNIRHT